LWSTSWTCKKNKIFKKLIRGENLERVWLKMPNLEVLKFQNKQKQGEKLPGGCEFLKEEQ